MLGLRGTQFVELIHSLWYNVRVDANKMKLGFGFKRRWLLNHSFNYARLLLATHYHRPPSFGTICITQILDKITRSFEIGSSRGHNTSSEWALGITQDTGVAIIFDLHSADEICLTLWCTFTAAVVLTFFVCWAPFHAQRLLYLYGQRWEHYKTFNEWLFVSGGYLYYISW